ncbi:MFS transporter, partial [Staphylococcus aureus]|nr:MFS transporter [Staphylococcus aureus]
LLGRLVQGLSAGVEVGGVSVYLNEIAPPDKKGFFCSWQSASQQAAVVFAALIGLVVSSSLDPVTMQAWGWRIPFVASALLVGLGLWVRLNIHETPDFKKALERKAPVRLPMWTVLRDHPVPMLLGTLGAFATFVLFYLMTVFSLGHGTAVLGYSREQFLLMQMAGMLFFALGIPLSARYGDRWGTQRTMIVASVLIVGFGVLFATLF